MNFEMAKVSNGNGLSFGIILVLFILMVIATKVFYRPLENSNVQQEDLSTIQGSRGFNVLNRTSLSQEVILNATNYSDFTGSFEPPGPSPHTTPAGKSYHFEVLSSPFRTYTAEVTYNLVLPNRVVIGDMKIAMIVNLPLI
ncbi:hypothetical protein M3223_14670 [Paenibacillus pasadenensis]|uniref:hypothetical protein n=1 Tax=Paenibacillus pasadenensis TaxID=217090 RepID=UPI0020416FE5|nr:hypothetical protein [Paenibacillus pasadenensis]MCM3748592.1 hypothetical protein [Paenibacillus pasadenensis]